MTSLIRRWNAFWFGPISARPLGAFRIAFGLIMLLNLTLLSIEADYWLSDAGLLRGTEAREAAGPLRPSLLHYVQDPASVRVFLAGMFAVAVLFTLGWRTRVMAVLLYLGQLSIHHRNISSCSGADVMVVIVAFYLMLSPCGAAFSLDARRLARRRGTAAEPLIVPWAQRLIQIQLALVYLNTALLKADGAAWQNGTALHFVEHNAELRRFYLGFSQYPLLLNALTYAALMIEFAIPFLIWFRATRPWMIVSGLALHGGILLTVNIPIFGEIMTACYLTFLGPEELGAFTRRLDPRTWFRRPVAEPADGTAVAIPGLGYGISGPPGPLFPAPAPTAAKLVEVG